MFTQERAPRESFKVNNRNTEQECENYSKLTIKRPEQLSILLIVKF